MPLNIAALEEARDELKARIAEDTECVAALDRLINNAVTPKAKAVAEPVKRRGGRVKEVKDDGVSRVKVSRTDAPGGFIDAPKMHTITCKKCSARYVSARANGACPVCNPRVVTAKEAFA